MNQVEVASHYLLLILSSLMSNVDKANFSVNFFFKDEEDDLEKLIN